MASCHLKLENNFDAHKDVYSTLCSLWWVLALRLAYCSLLIFHKISSRQSCHTNTNRNWVDKNVDNVCWVSVISKMSRFDCSRSRSRPDLYFSMFLPKLLLDHDSVLFRWVIEFELALRIRSWRRNPCYWSIQVLMSKFWARPSPLVSNMTRNLEARRQSRTSIHDVLWGTSPLFVCHNLLKGFL